MPESIERLFAEGTLRYSQVWEDHLLAEEGLKAGPGDDVLSIASAGCNVLGLLLRDVKRVVAIDLNPSQLSVVELKLRAIETLTRAGNIAAEDTRVTKRLLDRSTSNTTAGATAPRRISPASATKASPTPLPRTKSGLHCAVPAGFASHPAIRL